METDLATVTYNGRLFVVEAVEFHGGARFVSATVEGEPVMVSRAVAAELAALFTAARAPKATDDAVTMRDADERNTAGKSRGQFRVVHSRPAPPRCRPGRAW
jgi:hypothetical protein